MRAGRCQGRRGGRSSGSGMMGQQRPGAAGHPHPVDSEACQLTTVGTIKTKAASAVRDVRLLATADLIGRRHRRCARKSDRHADGGAGGLDRTLTWPRGVWTWETRCTTAPKCGEVLELDRRRTGTTVNVDGSQRGEHAHSHPLQRDEADRSHSKARSGRREARTMTERRSIAERSVSYVTRS